MMTTEQIARISGLSLMTVKNISRLRSWSSVKVDVADRFMIACGVNPLQQRRHIAYLKRTLNDSKTGFRHISDPRIRGYMISLMTGARWKKPYKLRSRE